MLCPVLWGGQCLAWTGACKGQRHAGTHTADSQGPRPHRQQRQAGSRYLCHAGPRHRDARQADGHGHREAHLRPPAHVSVIDRHMRMRSSTAHTRQCAWLALAPCRKGVQPSRVRAQPRTPRPARRRARAQRVKRRRRTRTLPSQTQPASRRAPAPPRPRAAVGRGAHREEQRQVDLHLREHAAEEPRVLPPLRRHQARGEARRHQRGDAADDQQVRRDHDRLASMAGMPARQRPSPLSLRCCHAELLQSICCDKDCVCICISLARSGRPVALHRGRLASRAPQKQGMGRQRGAHASRRAPAPSTRLRARQPRSARSQARQVHARRAPQPRVRQQHGVQHADARVHPRIAALGEGPALAAVRRVHERGRVDGVVQQHGQHVPLRPRPRSQGGEPGRGDKVVTRSQGESGRGEPGRHCRHPTAFAPAP